MSLFDKILYLFFVALLAFLFVKFFLGLALILILLGFFRTWQMKKEPNQQEFLQGSLPNPRPDGFYQGNVGFKTSWIGKKFDAEHATGINVIVDPPSRKASAGQSKKSGQVDKYPFKTSVAKGLFDEHLLVFKIDYNVKGNPFWIRWILDEVVQVGPDQYLGKMQLRIIPGFAFSVLYFELKK